MGRTFRLNPTMVHVLLSLAAGPAHGYGMMKAIEQRTRGSLDLGPSSLYYTLGRLEDAGLVEAVEVDLADGDPHEDQRRYFRLTDAGRLRLDEELAQLSRLVGEGHRLGFGREA